MKVKTWLHQIAPDLDPTIRGVLLKVAFWLCVWCRDDEPLYEDRYYPGGVWHRHPTDLSLGTECEADKLWVEIRAGRLP